MAWAAVGIAMTGCGRFAPSPTGRLHFGSLVAALGSWLYARASGARWIVRMEDLDRERELPGAADDIIATLTAFGLESDGPILRQSTREAAYRDALDRLRADDRVFACWCSRAALQPYAGIHPLGCIAPSSTRLAPAFRLRVAGCSVGFDDAIQGRQAQDLGRDVGDFVVWRSDGACAYQLAVVVDDAAQGVDSVVRGADLLDSTPRQILLQRMLGLPTPRYAHLPLVVDADGRKLSKHAAALAVDPNHPLPALRAALDFLGQRVPQAGAVAALLSKATLDFAPSSIPKSAPAPTAFVAAQKDVCDGDGHNETR